MKTFLESLNEATVGAYAKRPGLIAEHYGIEQTVLAGGYGYRQILELVQNGADAILEAHEGGRSASYENQVHVILRESHLYVANTGAPVSKEGIDALLSSHRSPKRGNQIGRFGLGFKSLLRLGGRIDLFMQDSVAIRFDPERCRRELMEKFNVPNAPGLRLAWPLEETTRNADPALKGLSWAETVVRVEVGPGDLLDHLRKEIGGFPAEFLLFFPLDAALILDDGERPARELRVKMDGLNCRLQDGDESSQWHVAKREVRIKDERAVCDATHIHAREVVPLAWAIPVDGKREETGRFWAFFPTHTPTYLAGILNGPWKLNSDRNAIIGGDWNDALMREAARLIADTLPALSTESDPGRPLDAFPRQLERLDEDAAPLVDRVWELLLDAAVIPDASGTIRFASELWRHPLNVAIIAKRWQELACPTALACHVHPSCLEHQRGSRLKALGERLEARLTSQSRGGGLRQREVNAWFAYVASTELRKAVQVLELAEAYAENCTPSDWRSVRPLLAIIPAIDGKLLRPEEVLFAPAGVSIPDRSVVDTALCDIPEMKRILQEVMKVRALDDSVWETVLQTSLPSIASTNAEKVDLDWRKFWERLRSAPATVRLKFVCGNKSGILVRRHSGYWVCAGNALLPGALISAEDPTANHDLITDLDFHRDDLQSLQALGVRDVPEGIDSERHIAKAPSLEEWLKFYKHAYKQTHRNSASWDYLEPLGLTMPVGWWLLKALIGIPQAKLTELLLARLAGGEFCGQLEFGHCTVPNYPRIKLPHPFRWLLLKHGTVLIGETPVRLAAIAARSAVPDLAKIENWNMLRAALDKLQDVMPPVSAAESDIHGMWRALIGKLASPAAVASDNLRELWAGAAHDQVVPETLPTDSALVPISRVFVTGSGDLARHAQWPGRLVVTLDDHALRLWVEKGARPLDELMRPEWTEASGPDALLVSVFPELGEVMLPDVRKVASSRSVFDLKLVVGESSHNVPCLMWKNSLLLDMVRLLKASRAERLRVLVNEVAAAGWLNSDPGKALQQLGDARMDERRSMVAQASSLAERLLRAVGGRTEPLRSALGNVGEMHFIQQCQPLQLAELTLSQLGPATLAAIKEALNDEGLRPPSRWNTPEARAFVASIGFPEEFGASPDTRREAEEYISGPITLPALHDFQEEVLEGVKSILGSGKNRRRGVVSLPTGGGKTRVIVEAAVLLVLKPRGSCRIVVWVAQTDELCEQAVQAFRQVWLNLGAQNTDLRIVRLWGGNPNPSMQDPDKPLVVVASIQTLNSRMGAVGLTWLQKPGLVVVDECHHAITPSYTNLLRWLDAEAPRPGTEAKHEPPIIGLSATPFRTDDEETRRLAKRFDSRWLPADQQRLHLRLLSQGVLSNVDYEPLQSGVGLLAEEIHRLSQLSEPWEGLDFENVLEQINQRLAGDKKRNERLVERIQACAERSVLFFANSVLHAQEISARLNLVGIAAAAISGGTPTSSRRYFLDRFQRGTIRVLCNHSVLTTGFDAPKTDMVLIARQVFSPVRYMQMVGRGLRGEKNGGTARCRIVTVVDNLGRFQDRHPFHYCEQYFTELAGEQ